MNLPIPSTIIIIIIACILAGLILLRIVSDVRAGLQSRQLFRKLVTVGKQKTLQSFGIIIELSEKAEHIIPLLDHLYGHRYRSLQIIVVVKHTAGKNAIAIIERYRRSEKVTGLRIIKHKAGLGINTIIQKYSTGKIILLLTKHQRLSDAFFNDISLDFAVGQQHIVIPQTLVRPGHSITSGLQSLDNLWKRFAQNVNVPVTNVSQRLSIGTAYSRKLITRKPPVAITKISQRAYISSINQPTFTGSYLTFRTLATAQLFRRPFILLVTIFTLLAFVGVAYIVPAKDFLLLIATIGIIYTALIVSFQFETKGYSVIDRVNLGLLTPFYIIFNLLYVVIATILALTQNIVSVVQPVTKRRRQAKPVL